MQPEVSEVLRRYVSNLDRNVYTIMNLPEEVVAVIFAYVSRSPKSFRENLVRLLADKDIAVGELASGPASVEDAAFSRASEEARKFHEKWVVGYGHSSVAEHGVVHVGIEGISRLASAHLELSNPFLSFTEYSQRYQRPERDRFVTPDEIAAWPVLAERFESVQHLTFDAYERIEEGLFAHLAAFNPPRADEDDGRYRSRIGRMGFEDARYVLTLAVETNLGMTANGRALRDALVTLLADGHGEVRRLAGDIERETVRVLPTLLRHVGPRQERPAVGSAIEQDPEAPPVLLLAHTGQGTRDPLEAALRRLVDARAVATGRSVAPSDLGRAYRASFFVPEGHAPLPEEADHVSYTFRLLVSEANWHQLLRHVRRTAFTPSPPGIGWGYVVPPTIAASGLESLFRATVRAAETLYRDVSERAPLAAHYLVTNAHRRLVLATLSLRELAHLVRVRGAANAQWDIRDTVEAMARAVEEVHPGILAPLLGEA